MVMPISAAQSLPRELLTIISDYLLNEDRFACIFVCRSWSVAFTPAFYQSVSISSSRQCNLFYDALILSGQKKKSAKWVFWATLRIGHAVRHISIRAFQPNNDLVRRLPDLCPYLRQVSISNDVLSDASDFIRMGNDCSTVLASHLSPLCRMLPMLTGLTITIREGLQSLSWLSHLGKLTHLSINCWNNMRQTWDFDRMDNLHRWCPELQDLYLVLERTHFSKTDLLVISNDIQQQRKLDVPGHRPALALKRVHLKLPYQYAEYHAAAWLVYFARKYPNLTDMGLETCPDYSVYAMAFSLEYMDDPVLTTAIETARLNAYRVFAAECRHVTRIQFKDLGLYRHFFHALCDAGHSRLEHLGMDEMRNFPSGTLALCFDNFCDSLRSLELQCACYMNINFPWSLRQLPHLTRLVLCGPYGGVPIDTLLDCCPKLAFLELSRVRLTWIHPHCASSASHSALKHLVLKTQRVGESFLMYIGNRCPALEELQMIRCFVTKTSKNGQLLVSLPHQIMTRIAFQDIEMDGVVRVVAVRMAQHDHGTYQWFDLNVRDRIRRNQRKEEEEHRVLGVMRSRQRGAVLKLSNHIMIDCRSLGQLHVDQERLLL